MWLCLEQLDASILISLIDHNRSNHDIATQYYKFPLEQQQIIAALTFLFMEYVMEKRQCLECCQLFYPCPQVPHQSYCSSPNCQRARRRKWMRNKLKTDSDYQENQLFAQKAWSKRNTGYWKEYRASHPEYVERNRISQHQRNTKSQANIIANIDESSEANPFPSGIYRLSLVSDNAIAKMNMWTVEIRIHSCKCVSPREIAKR